MRAQPVIKPRCNTQMPPIHRQNSSNSDSNSQRSEQQINGDQPPILQRPDDWAEGIGSLSVISALIFGFSAAVLTNVQQPIGGSHQKQHYFAGFVILLCISIGLSFIGLAVSSIMYHNVKGFQAYGLAMEHLLEYERHSYLIKNIGYYMIYISWAALIIALILYCWIWFDESIAIAATVITSSLLFAGIIMGARLANMFAKFSGDDNIFNVMNPEQIEQVSGTKCCGCCPWNKPQSQTI